MALHQLVSVCAGKDAENWRYIAPQILSNIQAESYVLIVPDAELAPFRAMTPAKFTVSPESDYLGGWSIDLVRTLMTPELAFRAGWYLQQLVKISALSRGDDDDDVVLIWDADTMPLRRLEFVNPDGSLNYYKNTEQIKQPYGDQAIDPYFVTLHNLLGLEKIVNFSFIAQCFPCYVAWAREFIAEIEAKHGCHWIEAIFASADLSKLSAFSEYETLGNYLQHRHGDKMVITNRPWEHLGSTYIGIEHMTEKRRQRFGEIYDFIAFEHWQKTVAFHPPIEYFFKHFFAGSQPKKLLILGIESVLDFPIFGYILAENLPYVAGAVLVDKDEDHVRAQESLQFAPQIAVEFAARSDRVRQDYLGMMGEIALLWVTEQRYLAQFADSLPDLHAVQPDSPLPGYILLPYAENPNDAAELRQIETKLTLLSYRFVPTDRLGLYIRFPTEIG